jgi:protein TonB
MLAYATSRSGIAARRSSPNALLFVIGAHVAAVAVLMSARMELPQAPGFTRTIVDLIPLPKDPPPPQRLSPKVPLPPQPLPQRLDHPMPRVPLDPIVDNPADSGTPTADPAKLGAGAAVIPDILPPPKATPVKTAPRLLTPPSELKPPYPASKLLNEEEGAVTLKLTINEQGRVIGVEPVGRADPAFLDAARRHVIAHWRFKPASQDGRAVASTTSVTLRFELDG